MKNVISGVALSFFSGHFYGELARHGRGIGMGLITALTLLITILFFLTFVAGGEFADARAAIAQLPAVADTLPALTVKDGTLSIDKPVPYTLTLGKDADAPRIVVDTGYKVTDITALEKYMQQNKVFVLVTADKFISRTARSNSGTIANGELRISDFKDSQPFSVTHDNWRALGATIAGWGVPALLLVAFFAMFCGLFLANFFSTVFSAIAIMIFDLAFRVNLEFPVAMRLAAAFRIPVVFLSSLPLALGMQSLSGLSAWILWGLYLVFAVWSVRLYDRQKA